MLNHFTASLYKIALKSIQFYKIELILIRLDVYRMYFLYLIRFFEVVTGPFRRRLLALARKRCEGGYGRRTSSSAKASTLKTSA